jgi:hypothetical protein
MASNISLQSVCDYVLTNVRGAPIQDVLGVQNEPALSICNDMYQEVLQKPLTWRFNKANCASTGLGILYFTSNLYQQDYPLTNGNVSPVLNPQTFGCGTGSGQVVHIPTVYNNGFVANGATATVTTNWPHGYQAGATVYFQNIGQWGTGGVWTPTSAINSTTGFVIQTVPSTTSFTINTTVAAGNYGAPGINDIGWIERTVFEDFANTATLKPRHSIEVTMNLELESIVQPPFKLSYQYTTFDAALATNQLVPSTTAVFRSWPVPSQQIWGMMVDYQMAPQTFTDLSNTWGVWPDPLIFVIRQGVKAAALDFVEDPRAVSEYQLFEKKLDSVRDIRDQERPSQTMFPDRPIMFGG